MALLTVQGLRKRFGGVDVLNGIDLAVEKGDVIAVLGASGGGKTTLLRCLNFLERADSGMLTFDGARYDLRAISKRDVLSLRKKTGFVFQSYNLFRNKTALQNVTEGLVVARRQKKAEAEAVAREMLTKVGMAEKADAYPYELSGGQQQRVAIARALATRPEIIYFDEPTSALDPERIGEVLAVMKTLADEGMTMLVVTHELHFAKQVSNKVLFIDGGSIVESAPSHEFFASPRKARTQEFLRTLNKDIIQ